MSFTFETEYAPGQAVIITALERVATVVLVRIDGGRTVDYFVTWWDEGKRHQEWLQPQELVSAKSARLPN